MRSLRVEHPKAALGDAMKRWLEPMERRALACPTCSLECTAGIVHLAMVSVECVELRGWEPDPTQPPGEQGGSTEPERRARTWSVDGERVHVLTKRDVVGGDGGDLAADGVSVASDGVVRLCTGNDACDEITPAPSFRAVVDRLLD